MLGAGRNAMDILDLDAEKLTRRSAPPCTPFECPAFRRLSRFQRDRVASAAAQCTSQCATGHGHGLGGADAGGAHHPGRHSRPQEAVRVQIRWSLSFLCKQCLSVGQWPALLLLRLPSPGTARVCGYMRAWMCWQHYKRPTTSLQGLWAVIRNEFRLLPGADAFQLRSCILSKCAFAAQ